MLVEDVYKMPQESRLLLVWEEEDAESSSNCLYTMSCKQGAKERKKIFVSGFLEIPRDALKKGNTSIINRCRDGICWNFLTVVSIKMFFFGKSISRKLETKKFEVLESTFSGGRTDISQFLKNALKRTGFLQQHLESFALFHPES